MVVVVAVVVDEGLVLLLVLGARVELGVGLEVVLLEVEVDAGVDEGGVEVVAGC
jgi:hypothetical protein